jgi:hypothetical protein
MTSMGERQKVTAQAESVASRMAMLAMRQPAQLADSHQIAGLRSPCASPPQVYKDLTIYLPLDPVTRN